MGPMKWNHEINYISLHTIICVVFSTLYIKLNGIKNTYGNGDYVDGELRNTSYLFSHLKQATFLFINFLGKF